MVDFDGVRETFATSSCGSGMNEGATDRVDRARRVRSAVGAGAAALAPLLTCVAEASAKDGEFGIIEGRTASFIHPIIMVRDIVQGRG